MPNSLDNTKVKVKTGDREMGEEISAKSSASDAGGSGIAGGAPSVDTSTPNVCGPHRATFHHNMGIPT